MDTLISYEKFRFPRGKPSRPADFQWVSAAQLIVCECSRSNNMTRAFAKGFIKVREIIRPIFRGRTDVKHPQAPVFYRNGGTLAECANSNATVKLTP